MHYTFTFAHRCHTICSFNSLSLLITLGLISPAAYAARPMITDDARITDAHTCQLESWIKNNRDSNEYWALPACNPGGNLELTAGGALSSDATGSHTTALELQAKTLLKVLEPNNWGLGLSAGTVQHPQTEASGNVWYVNLPASFSFNDDRMVLHANLGWLNDQQYKRQNLTWGLGSETRLSELSWLIAETFGQNDETPFYQLGLRHWIALNRIQVDMTYGNRIGSNNYEQWFSLGLRLLSRPL